MIKRVKPFWKDHWVDDLKHYMSKYDFWEKGITEDLENEILDMVKLRNKPRYYALVVDSTSNAIWMCLYMWSKRYPERNEVILPNWGYPAAFKAAEVLGLKVVPIDMRRDTLGMSEYGVEKALNNKTLAVIHIESNGVVGDPYTIQQMIPSEVLFIEDSAPSILQENAGTFGDISMFSFSPTKPFCVGGGSVMLMNDKDMYNFLKKLRHTPDYENKAPTLNFMLSPYLMALLLPQLKYFMYIFTKRTLNHIHYRRQLEIFEEPKISTNAHGSIMYFAKKPAEVSKALSQNHIQHRWKGYPCYSEVTTKYPVSHYIRKHMIDLPSHHELEEEDITKICNIVRKADA